MTFTMVMTLLSAVEVVCFMANVFGIKNLDVVTLTVWGQLLGSKVLNTLHFMVHGLAAPLLDAETEVQNLVAKMYTAAGSFGDLLKNLQTPDYMLEFVRAQRVWDTRAPYVQVNVGTTGTYASDPESSNVNAVIVKRSAVVGRGRSGDYHVPGLGKLATEGAFLTPVYQANLQTAANELTVEQPFLVGTGFWRPIVGVPTAIGQPETTVIQATAQQEVRVMVKRTAFRGI